MQDFFDEDVARAYDAEHTDAGDLQHTVDFLVRLAGKGRTLELAIGTGRVALPLVAAGVEVSGIELSEQMVAQLRAKRGGESIPVAIGDMATTQVEGDFALVFLVFNTICNLTSQDEQVACFRNAAAHLKPGGHFVIETIVPPLQRLPFGETKIAFDLGEDHWGIDEVDVSSQRFTSHHIWMRGDETVRRSIPFRYVWPSELDLMAQISGMSLTERWADWERTPFTRESLRHISVWRKD